VIDQCVLFISQVKIVVMDQDRSVCELFSLKKIHMKSTLQGSLSSEGVSWEKQGWPCPQLYILSRGDQGAMAVCSEDPEPMQLPSSSPSTNPTLIPGPGAEHQLSRVVGLCPVARQQGGGG
jgi:hypothetical protein